MSALLLKDSLILWRHMKLLLLVVFIFSALPAAQLNAYAVMYGAMLPYSLAAYDAQSKWDRLEAMLPYSVWDVVLSRYIVGWVCITGSAVLAAAAQWVVSLFYSAPSFSLPSSLLMLFLSLCGAVCALAVTMPLLFRFGAEKGRVVFMLMVFLVCLGAGMIGTLSERADGATRALTLLPPLCAVILTALSIPLSMRMYRKRH